MVLPKFSVKLLCDIAYCEEMLSSMNIPFIRT